MILVWFLLSVTTQWSLADVQVSAIADQSVVGEDEAVTLQIRVEGDSIGDLTDPTYQAPDFDLVHEYQSSSRNLSIVNGSVSSQRAIQFVKVLRPKRKGTLKISNIVVKNDGQELKAADVEVEVGAGGAGTPPPRNHAGAGGPGLKSAGNRTLEPFFVRAEVDKKKLYKGEQLVVSYYLYRSTQVFNIAVQKYPSLEGFIREDLEMPITGSRLDFEQVLIDGKPYLRSLLARYAAYPLQVGQLPIDSMALKAAYQGRSSRANDPFGGFDDENFFSGFFQRVAPQEKTSTSEIFKVEVQPLPDQGKPASFTGGVGEFTVSATVDKAQVKANEAVTLQVKIAGRGNLQSIEDLKRDWPTGIELYESKGRTKSGKSGQGEKVFEYLLIPREAGTYQVPALEYGFFNPVKRQYEVKRTEPFALAVSPGEGTAVAAKAPKAISSADSTRKASPEIVVPAQIMGLSFPGDYELPPQSRRPKGFESVVLWGTVGCFVFTLLAFLVGGVRRRKPQQRVRPKKLRFDESRLVAEAKKVAQSSSREELAAFSAHLEDEIFALIEMSYGLVGARALAREELGRLLTESYGLDATSWGRLREALEYTETVRFALNAVADSDLKSQLLRKVGDVSLVAQQIQART